MTIDMFELEAIPGVAALFYNAVAAKGFTGLYRRIAEEITDEVKSGKILDIGTGPGYVAIEIAKLNSHLEIVGIDLSPKMVSIANKNSELKRTYYPEGDHLGGRVTFEIADAHDLPYHDNSFDFVFSTFSLHHWKRRDRVLNECARVVKDNGLVWIYDFRRDATRQEIKKTIDANRTDFRHLYLSYFLPLHGLRTEEFYSTKMKEDIEKNGFLSFKVEKKDAIMCIKSKRCNF